jgi:hypothetical protein
MAEKPEQPKRSFWSENPTVVLSLMYADLTAIGILYSLFYYRQFGINIFDFAQIVDFLLAALKAPGVTIAVLIVQLPLYFLLSLLFRLFSRFRSDIFEDFDLELLVYLAGFITLVGVLAVTTVMVPLYLARSQADAIKQGKQSQAVTVQQRKYSKSAEQVTEPGLRLIGATQNAAFFYDADPKRTLVIPHAQLVSIEVPE